MNYQEIKEKAKKEGRMSAVFVQCEMLLQIIDDLEVLLDMVEKTHVRKNVMFAGAKIDEIKLRMGLTE